jgi:hypothetical protein
MPGLRLGASVRRDEASDLLVINGQYSAALVLSRCRHSQSGRLRWFIPLDRLPAADITVVVRMDPANDQPEDYYLLPRIGVDPVELRLAEANGAAVDTFRFDNLDYFLGMAALRRIEVAA